MQVSNFFQRYILLLSECFLCYKMSRVLGLASEEESSPWSPKARAKSCCWSDRILCTLCLSFSSSPFILSRTKLSVKTKIKSMKCKRFSKMVKMYLQDMQRTCIKGRRDWTVCRSKEKLNGSEHTRSYEIPSSCLLIYFVNLYYSCNIAIKILVLLRITIMILVLRRIIIIIIITTVIMIMINR